MKKSYENWKAELENQVILNNEYLAAKPTLKADQQQENHKRIEKNFFHWFKEIKKALSELTDSEIDKKLKPFLISALLGLARIYHTSLNSEIKAKRNRPEKTGMVTWLEKNVYGEFLIAPIPTHTVDGNWIDWKGEIAQDFVGTAIALKMYKHAIGPAQEAIDSGYERLASLPDDADAGQRAAITSALSVLYRRRGEASGSQRDRVQSLNLAKDSNQILRNDQRLLNLAQHAFQASVTDWTNIDPSNRAINFFEGGRIVLEQKVKKLRQSIRNRN